VPRPFAAFAKGRVPGTFAVKAYAERFRNEISVQPTFTRTLSATHAAGIANPMVPAASYPPFAKNAKDGAPRVPERERKSQTEGQVCQFTMPRTNWNELEMYWLNWSYHSAVQSYLARNRDKIDRPGKWQGTQCFETRRPSMEKFINVDSQRD